MLQEDELFVSKKLIRCPLSGVELDTMGLWFVPIPASNGCPPIRINMNDESRPLRAIRNIGFVFALAVSMSADAGLFGLGGTSWKEEVLLHDGSKIIVERSVERGGRHEIGQQQSIKEESLTFTLLTTNDRITWKNEFSKDVGFADFMPMLLDIFQGTAYVVSVPAGCISYNKWGRPNPPYVIFKYQGKAWQRITIQELPAEFKTPNLIISSPDNEVDRLGKSYITVAMVQAANSRLTQPEYRTILREALPQARINEMCEERVLYKGSWILPNDNAAKGNIDQQKK